MSIANNDFLNNDGLQLEENHFSDDALDTVSEIEKAIAQCKENILSLKETSEEKRLMVQRLVKLRLKLQEVQEIEIYMDPKKMKIVQSHKFVITSVTKLKFETSQIYCETCSGIVWIPVQSLFVCSGEQCVLIKIKKNSSSKFNHLYTSFAISTCVLYSYRL